MAKYSKLIAAIIAPLVGFLMAFLAAKGFGECTIVNGEDVCSVFGISQEVVTGAIVSALTALGVFAAPANATA